MFQIHENLLENALNLSKYTKQFFMHMSFCDPKHYHFFPYPFLEHFFLPTNVLSAFWKLEVFNSLGYCETHIW